MRIDDIEIFRVLAETLSYTNTANRLYLTQSSLTRTIQQMEEELGFQLFDRSRRSVALTAAGQRFYTDCERILQEYDNSVENARCAEEGDMGTIRFATHAFFPYSVVFDIIRGFQTEHPDILLRISSSSTERMIYDINEDSVDCAVCTGKPADKTIDRIVLKHYRECAVLSPSHPLADRDELSFEDLSGERFMVISRTHASRGYEIVKSKARAAGFDPYIEEKADSVSHLLAYISTGRYISILSDNYRKLTGDYLRFVPLAEETTVDLAFIWKRTNPNPCVKSLADYVRSNFKRRIGDSV